MFCNYAGAAAWQTGEWFNVLITGQRKHSSLERRNRDRKGIRRALPALLAIAATLCLTGLTGATPAPAAPPPPGSALAWGDNVVGQLGIGSTPSDSTLPIPVDLPAGVGITAVAAGLDHSLGVTSDGSVLAWGDNTPQPSLAAAPTPSP